MVLMPISSGPILVSRVRAIWPSLTMLTSKLVPPMSTAMTLPTASPSSWQNQRAATGAMDGPEAIIETDLLRASSAERTEPEEVMMYSVFL